MRRLLPLAAALAALGAFGCGGREAVKPDSSPAPRSDGAAKTRAKADAAMLRADAASVQPEREPGFDVVNKTDDGRRLPAPTGTVSPGVEAAQRRELESRKGRILGIDPEGCTWVAGEAIVVVGDQDTPAQARAAAVDQARAAAVQDFLGVDVNSKFMDYQQEGLRHDSHLVESLLQTTRNGRIIKEKLVERGYRDMPDCPSCRYHVKLEACVLPLAADRDRDFRVEVRILSRVKFIPGDEAKLAVTATRDCSVYLYDVYDLAQDNKTALVVPNEAVPSKTLKAGETWEYPDEDAKKRGVRLVAELPKNADVSAETIIVVATKTPLPSAVYDPTKGGYLGVLRRLHHSQIAWAEDSAAYTIYNGVDINH